MRISTAQIYTQATQSMMEGQTRLAEIQAKIGSGKNFTSLAEDPVGANQVVNLTRELAQIEMFGSNIDSTRRRLELEETTLDAFNIAADRLRELTVQASNGVLTDADRISISYEMDELANYFANLMNTRDAKGEFIFAGSKGTTQTYSLDANGRYAYNGDQTVRQIQVASSQFVESTDSGFDLFESVYADPEVAVLGGDNNISLGSVLANLDVTDPARFENFFRSTGDLRVSVTEGNGTQSYYSVTDSSGNPITTTDGQTLDMVAYDNTSSAARQVTLSIAGAELSLQLPQALSTYPDPDSAGTLDLNDPSFRVTTDATTAPTVTVTNEANYADFMKAVGGAIEIRSVETATPGVYEYQAFQADGTTQITGATLPPSLAVTSGANSGDTLTFSTPDGAALTVVMPASAADGSESVTLDFVAAETVSLKLEKSKGNVVNTLLDSVDAIRELTASNENEKAQLTEQLNTLLDNITATQERVGESLARIGARVNAIDSAESSNLDFRLLTQQTLSAVEDLDYASASTDLARRQLALEASFASFAKIQGLSLFNYIN